MDSEYPKTKYHVRGGGSITVSSAAQEKALGADWVIIPAEMPTEDKKKSAKA